MNIEARIKTELIAPCGMNCAICMGHLLRDENICPGCRGNDADKPRNCQRCIIANCDQFKFGGKRFCSEKCAEFPCRRLKELDTRYRSKYKMSMLANLKNIEDMGIRAFIRNEKVRWSCSECGGLICVHRGYCSICGREKPNTPKP